MGIITKYALFSPFCLMNEQYQKGHTLYFIFYKTKIAGIQNLRSFSQVQTRRVQIFKGNQT